MATPTWGSWNDTSSSTLTSDTWVSWTTSTLMPTSSSTTTSGDQNVWYIWNTADDTSTTVNTEITYTWENWTIEAEEKKEERAETKAERRRLRQLAEQRQKDERARIREQKRKEKAKERKRKKAEETAIKLLEDLIGKEEITKYKRTGKLLVHGEEFDWLITKLEGYYQPKVRKIIRSTKQSIAMCLHVKDEKVPQTDKVIDFALYAKNKEKELDKMAGHMNINDISEDELQEAAVMR